METKKAVKIKETIEKKKHLSATAFAPGHITGFFEICDREADPLNNGSRGAGISLAQGIFTRVSSGSTGDTGIFVRINGKQREDAVVSGRVAELFFDKIEERPRHRVEIEHTVEVPIGAGFGSSGAAALSLAYALNAAWGEPLSRSEAGQIAHRAEVECKTGLGTVLADTVGELEVRVKAGAPGVGVVRSFPLESELVVLCFVFGPLSTRASLSNAETRARINAAGAALLDRFLSGPGAECFMRCAREFAEAVGLITPRLRAVLTELDAASVPASMPMFGEAVFCLVKKSAQPELKKKLARAIAAGAHVFEFAIAKEGGKTLSAP